MQQVLRGPILHAHLKHQRSKQISARLLNINLDASDDTHFDIRDGFNDALDIPMCDLVHSVGELCHGLLCSLDLCKIGLQRFPDVDELVIKCISALGYSDL